MSKHTKGPWKVLLDLNRKGYDRVVSANDVRVVVANDIYEKDAKLIAAAPEMLQTLIDLALACEEAIGADRDVDTQWVLATLNAAIAKAEGRE